MKNSYSSIAKNHTTLFRSLPLRTAESGTFGDRPPLNRGSAAPAAPGAVTTNAPAAPGGAVPDALVRKSDADWREPTATVPRSFVATDTAAIPLTPETDRALGVYVAFSQPGTHRVTLEDFPRPTGTTKPEDEGGVGAREAHEKFDEARVFYEPQVADITATVAGVPVADGDTVTLVQTQQARLAVTAAPAGAEHTLTTLRPAGGVLLRTDGTLLIARDANTAAPEPVEVSRVYRVGPDGTYSSGGLAGRRMHLAADLHVPVRALSVTIVDTLPVRDAPTPAAAVVASTAPGGRVFVLVPAAVCTPLTAQLPPTYPDGTPMDLVPVITPVAAPTDDARAFLGDGQAFEITFPADQNPHQQLDIRLTATTWIPEPGHACTDPGMTTATLTATITLQRI